jgi:hypothetical protein
MREEPLWVEDDATISDPDHETWRQAWLRIVGAPFTEADVVSRTDHGDSEVIVTRQGYELTRSYPGNNSIRRAPCPSA